MSDLLAALEAISNPRITFNEAMIQYIFYPLMQILVRNKMMDIPDHIMEKLLRAATILTKSWWWTMNLKMRGILLTICTSCVGITDKNDKGKARERDEETRLAAVQCLWELLHDHADDEGHTQLEKNIREERIKLYSTSDIGLLTQVLTSLLQATTTRDTSLQALSLKTILELLRTYIGTSYSPTILPGVVSTLSRVVTQRSGKTHPRGEAVKISLDILRSIIVLAIGDEICIREGVIRTYDSLDDLVTEESEEDPPINAPTDPGIAVRRTKSWLNATSVQLHRAMNVYIPPLVDHPTPIALEGLIDFCGVVLSNTPLTLPQSQQLLLMPLLLLTLHPLPTISASSRNALLDALSSTPSLSQSFYKLAQETLNALPQLLSSGIDERINQSIKILFAIAALSTHGLEDISKSISHLLGPNGHVEKWGWGILDGLQLAIPRAVFSQPNPERLLIQGNEDADTKFPEITIQRISDLETQDAFKGFLRKLGQTGGDEALFTVEWFVGYAIKGSGTSEASALWCAARLLEGIARAPLDSPEEAINIVPRSKRLQQHARWLTKLVASFWERDLDVEVETSHSKAPQTSDEDNNQLIEHVKGLEPLQALLKMGERAKSNAESNNQSMQRILYHAQAIQLLAISAHILETRFSTLLIQALYPILHSFVSSDPFLSATAFAALRHVAVACGYASIANMLLSNFDYALGSVSRYLTRQKLDMQAPKVLVILVKLVGDGIVDRAGDVVEECFDRLDDYHGYSVIVEGLVEVLLEVVKAVQREGPSYEELESANLPSKLTQSRHQKPLDDIKEFSKWYEERKASPSPVASEDFGPAPRREWKRWEESGKEEEKTENTQPRNDDEPKLSPTQQLVQHIVRKSVYFLTHPSALIRARILAVLSASVSTLSSIESSILPSVHTAWPFVLNRFKDPEPFVVVEAAELVNSLVNHVGHFMDTKVWEGVWPIFADMFAKLDAADKQSAMARRDTAHSIGTHTAYSRSHRLYSAILRTISRAIPTVTLNDAVVWEVLLACRRFLGGDAHEELQDLGRKVYIEVAVKNADAVWLVLGGAGTTGPSFLNLPHIKENADLIFAVIT
jgi:hypothetical protein